MHDVVIIGAGPAGLSAGLRAKQLNLDYVIIEKDSVANTIRNYSDDKPVLDYPKNVEILGSLEFHEMSRQELLEKWEKTAESLNIVFEEVKSITGNYIVETDKDKHETKCVLLAAGVQGYPVKIGAEGEEKAHYKLKEVSGCDVLVVGGGDSAVEAAVKLSEKCKVTLLYRKPGFFRVKPENLKKLEESRAKVIFESTVLKISDKSALLKTEEGEKTIPAEYVFIFAGTSASANFLGSLGLKLENGKPVYNEKYEAKENFFIAGDLTKEPLIKNAINQGYKIIEEIAKRKKE